MPDPDEYLAASAACLARIFSAYALRTWRASSLATYFPLLRIAWCVETGDRDEYGDEYEGVGVGVADDAVVADAAVVADDAGDEAWDTTDGSMPAVLAARCSFMARACSNFHRAASTAASISSMFWGFGPSAAVLAAVLAVVLETDGGGAGEEEKAAFSQAAEASAWAAREAAS